MGDYDTSTNESCECASIATEAQLLVTAAISRYRDHVIGLQREVSDLSGWGMQLEKRIAELEQDLADERDRCAMLEQELEELREQTVPDGGCHD